MKLFNLIKNFFLKVWRKLQKKAVAFRAFLALILGKIKAKIAEKLQKIKQFYKKWRFVLVFLIAIAGLFFFLLI